MASSKSGQLPEVKPELSDANSASNNSFKRRRKILKPGLTATKKERYFVEHNYTDHADDEETDFAAGTFDAIAKTSSHSTNGVHSSFTRKTGPLLKSGPALSFPFKLHNMMDNAQADGCDHIVSWQSHGRCFMIRDMDEFVGTVLPRYFKLNKITSFQRQLNLYGFRRLTQGADAGAYYHELFLRGKLFLCHKIQRMKNKGVGYKAASSPGTEPNFYLMKALPEVPLCSENGEISSEVNVSRGKEGPEKNCEREYLARLFNTAQEIQGEDKVDSSVSAPLDTISVARGDSLVLERSTSALSLPDMNPHISSSRNKFRNPNLSSQSAPAPRSRATLEQHGLIPFSSFKGNHETPAPDETIPMLPFPKKIQDHRSKVPHLPTPYIEFQNATFSLEQQQYARISNHRQDVANTNLEQLPLSAANELALGRFADEKIKASDCIIDSSMHILNSTNLSSNSVDGFRTQLGIASMDVEERKKASLPQLRKREKPTPNVFSANTLNKNLTHETDPIANFVWDPNVEEALETKDFNSQSLQSFGEPCTNGMNSKGGSGNLECKNIRCNGQGMQDNDEDANELDILVRSMFMD